MKRKKKRPSAPVISDAELEARQHTYKWGVGTDGDPGGITPQSSEEGARLLAQYRQASPWAGDEVTRMYYRADGDSPWREVVTIPGF